VVDLSNSNTNQRQETNKPRFVVSPLRLTPFYLPTVASHRGVLSSPRRNPKRDNKESTTHSSLASQEMLYQQHRQNWLHQNLPFPYHPMIIFIEIFTA